MARQSTTRLHVSGHRFLLRRMEHALVRGDIRMLDDPLRAQSLSLIAGAVLTVVIVAASAVLTLLRPPATLGSAPIVMVRDSGALYVRIGDTVHPVLNLASARLIVGAPANPEAVSGSAITNSKSGPLVGIPGAPATIAPPLSEPEVSWAVCDDATSTTVIAGGMPETGLAAARNVLVTARSDSAATTYLLYDGWRARVDLRNRAVVRALKLDDIVPKVVSRTLLDATPEASPLYSPHISGAGSPSPLRGYPVGSVVRVVRTAAEEFYVVLAEGVQRVGQLTADLIRFTDSQHDRDMATVAPDVIAAVPVVTSLDAPTFPERAGASDDGIVCTRWRSSSVGVESAVLSGNSLPTSGVTLAQADGDGPSVDAFSIAPGRSAYVRSVGIRGDSASTGALYYVNESGVVFGLHDEDTAKYLGLAAPPVPAPWPVLARLPRGPELSRDAASIARDTVGPS